jgi:hypothetical protein
VDRITEEQRRIAELVAGGAPSKPHQEIDRSRHAIRRAVVALYRPAKREPAKRWRSRVLGIGGQAAGWRVTVQPRASSWRMWLRLRRSGPMRVA